MNKTVGGTLGYHSCSWCFREAGQDHADGCSVLMKSELDELRSRDVKSLERIAQLERQLALMKSGDHPDYPWKRALDMAEDARLSLAKDYLQAESRVKELEGALRQLLTNSQASEHQRMIIVDALASIPHPAAEEK